MFILFLRFLKKFSVMHLQGHCNASNKENYDGIYGIIASIAEKGKAAND